VLLLDSSQHHPANPLFVEALGELSAERGFGCSIVDEADYLAELGGKRNQVARLLGRRGPEVAGVNKELVQKASAADVNVAVVVKGSYVLPHTVSHLRQQGIVVMNFATDDPFNQATTACVREALTEYDIYFSTKRAVMDDLRRAGCRRVEYMPFAYKPTVHFREPIQASDEAHEFACDVAFIGGADDTRAPFFERLVRAEPRLRLNLYGGYWDRYKGLRKYHRGLAVGRNFRLAVAGAAMCINLVRRANRDGHVMRTFELPACGAFVVAERTDEHEELFAEGREIAFFDGRDELVDVVRHYLPKGEERSRIAVTGQDKVRNGSHTYKDRLLAMLVQAGFNVA